LVNKNVLTCLLKDGKEVNAVMLVGRLFHARATVTQNELHGGSVKKTPTFVLFHISEENDWICTKNFADIAE